MWKKEVVRAVSLQARKGLPGWLAVLDRGFVWPCFISFSPSPKWVPHLTTLSKVKTCGTSTGHTETTLLSKEVPGSLAYSPVELANVKFSLKATNSPFPNSSPNTPTSNCSLPIPVLRMGFSSQYSTGGKVGFRSGYSTTDNCHAIYLTVKKCEM